MQQQKPPAKYHKTLSYSIRHLPNPPRHLRVKATGLSRRLQKEFLQNDDVEAFLLKVRGEILNVVKKGGDLLSAISEGEQDENKNGESGDGDINEQPSPENTEDINIVVTICCEEGRHRSVAFVEELARRLGNLKDEDDDFPQHWQVSINVMHRDIGGNDNEGEQSLGQNQRPNKAQAKTRQRDRREKEDRLNSSSETTGNFLASNYST